MTSFRMLDHRSVRTSGASGRFHIVMSCSFTSFRMFGRCSSSCRPVASCLETWLHLMGQDGGFMPNDSSPCTHNVSHRHGLFFRSNPLARIVRELQVASDGAGRWPHATTVLPLHTPRPSSWPSEPLKPKKSCPLIITPMIQSESKGRVGQEHRWRVL